MCVHILPSVEMKAINTTQLFHNDHANMVAFEVFVNITETNTRAKIHVQKLVSHACGIQICCSTAKTQWSKKRFQRHCVK